MFVFFKLTEKSLANRFIWRPIYECSRLQCILRIHKFLANIILNDVIRKDVFARTNFTICGIAPNTLST